MYFFQGLLEVLKPYCIVCKDTGKSLSLTQGYTRIHYIKCRLVMMLSVIWLKHQWCWRRDASPLRKSAYHQDRYHYDHVHWRMFTLTPLDRVGMSWSSVILRRWDTTRVTVIINNTWRKRTHIYKKKITWLKIFQKSTYGCVLLW